VLTFIVRDLVVDGVVCYDRLGCQADELLTERLACSVMLDVIYTTYTIILINVNNYVKVTISRPKYDQLDFEKHRST